MATLPRGQPSQGPTGPTGPRGPAGATDPDLTARVTALEQQVASLDARVTALESGQPVPPEPIPPEPIPPGPTKDLVKDFGAPTDGVTNCKPAMDAWLAWARTQTNPTLIIDGALATIFQTTTCLFTRLVPNCTIKGINGAVVSHINVGTPDACPMTMNHSHRSAIKSATAGSTTVTLVSAADADKYVAGQWCIVGGWETMTAASYPSALRFFEYHKITAINDVVLTLDAALSQDYLSTWPIEPTNQDGPASLYGIGGVYCVAECTPQALAACMEGTATISDLKVTKGFSSWSAGTTLLNNIDLSAATGPADASSEAFTPSLSRKYIFTNCLLPDSSEIDKMVDYIEFDNCTGPNYSTRMQSCTANTLRIKNCSLGNANAGGLGGSGINTIIENSTLGQCWPGPTDFGVSNSLTLTNVTVLGPWAVAVGRNAPPLSAFENRGNTGSGLLLRLAKNDPLLSAYAPAPLSRMIPGHSMALGYMPGGGPPNITPDGGQSIVSFHILSAYEDANYFYWQTNLTDIPSRTYNGQQPNMTWHYPLKSYSGPTPPGNWFVAP